jgi:hypothetical protein
LSKDVDPRTPKLVYVTSNWKVVTKPKIVSVTVTLDWVLGWKLDY